MSGIALEVAVILLLLVVNGVFAMSEMAVVAAHPANFLPVALTRAG